MISKLNFIINAKKHKQKRSLIIVGLQNLKNFQDKPSTINI